MVNFSQFLLGVEIVYETDTTVQNLRVGGCGAGSSHPPGP